MFVLNFKILGHAVPEKSLTKTSLPLSGRIGKKENGQIKQYVADSLLHDTTNQPDVCTKFQNPRSSSC